MAGFTVAIGKGSGAAMIAFEVKDMSCGHCAAAITQAV
jgi:hypothetical protein